MVACTLSRLLLLHTRPLLPFCASFAPTSGSKSTLLLSSETLEGSTGVRLLKEELNVGQKDLPLTVALAVLV